MKYVKIVDNDNKLNVENLRSLVRYINSVARHSQTSFKMYSFHSINGVRFNKKPIENTGCNTSCCALGFAAMYGIGDWEQYNEGEYFQFDNYGGREFTNRTIEFKDCNGDFLGISEWMVLFSENWTNDIDEFIARAEIVLSGEYDKLQIIEGDNQYMLNYDYKYDISKPLIT